MKRASLVRFCATLLLVVAAVVLLRRNEEEDDASHLVGLLTDAGIQFAVSPVELDLLQHRKIVIATDINAASAQRVIRGLLLLDAMDATRPIDLYIRTEGGWIDDAFGIVDVMKAITAPVNTHAVGGTHSSGAMVLAAGTGTRYAYPFSSIMFHATLTDDDGEYGGDRLDNRRLIQFWETHARLPAEWLKAQNENTCFLGPEQALEFGVVDQIRSQANTSPAP